MANQTFNDFSNSINQQQRTASLRKLTEFQLRNFMDVSFWRTPKKSEPGMAKETGDSEYYQLPKLAPGVRANLINIKLKYQEQIVNEAVYTYGFIGKRLNAELTGNQDLPAAEAKFFSDHLNAVRLAKPADKTQALLRLGSEPYIQLPVLLPSAPPVAIAPSGAAPVAVAPPKAAPFLFVPPVAGTPSGLLPPIFIPSEPQLDRSTPSGIPPLAVIPLDTRSNRRTPFSPLPSVDSTPNTPPWNRLVIGIGLPLIALIPLLADGSDDRSANPPAAAPVTATPGDQSANPPAAAPVTATLGGPSANSPTLTPTTGAPGGPSANPPALTPTTGTPCVQSANPPAANPTTGTPCNQSANPPAATPTVGLSDEGFPNMPPSSPTTGFPTGSPNTPLSVPTVANPISLEGPTQIPSRPIPEPSSLLGLAVAGAGLLAAKAKARNRK